MQLENSELKTRGERGKLLAILLSAVSLGAIVLACFWATLGSYFIADDFSQVVYASKIVGGNLDMLLSNFTGSYMQNPMMKIYRPCLLLSLVGDYAVWQTNAFGYFLTDVVLLFASALMLFLLLRLVTNNWGEWRSIAFALTSAALFASNPLHCESISFVSGRDNVISAFFYLLSLWCFVKNSLGLDRKLVVAGVSAFWISMLSKEMAISLAPLLAAMAFCLPQSFGGERESRLKERLILAIRVSTPIWISTVLYLFVRLAALGTFTGGYVGGGGAGLMTHLFERWTNPHTIFEIMCPLNSGVFSGNSRYKAELMMIYVVLAAVICYRFFRAEGAFQSRLGWLAALAFWTLTAVVPLYQLWGLGPNLEGARFLFFLTIPMGIYLPLMLYVPSDRFTEADNGAEASVITVGTIALACLVVWNVCVTVRNNTPWVFAGHQTRACMEQAQKLAASIPVGKKVLVLGIPKEESGAYMISNCATFNALVSPPFAMANYEDRFCTFDPIFYGRSELINAQRFNNLLSNPKVVGAYVWREKAQSFEQLQAPSAKHLKPSSIVPIITPVLPTHDVQVMPYATDRGVWDVREGSIRINSASKGSGVVVSRISANPSLYDFMELELAGADQDGSVFAYWQGSKSKQDDWCDAKHPVEAKLHPVSKSQTQRLRIRLSDHWQWFSQGTISRLRIELPPNNAFELHGIGLVPGSRLMPKLAVLNLQATGAGVYPVGKEGLEITADASLVEGCSSIRLELTKPDYFFADFLEDSGKCIGATIPAKRNDRLAISDKQMSVPAYYELRAVCLDEAGATIGEPSDPITIQRY